MDGMIAMDEARALVADVQLWPRVRDFLWDFVPQIHPARTSAVPGSSISALAASPRFKHHVLASLGVERIFHTFPKEDWSRIALLDGGTILEICKWLGALACADGLRKITSGAEVKTLRTELAGVYPEVFGYTMYFRGLGAEEACVQELDAGNVTGLGLGMLLSVMGECPENVVKRMMLKLPEDLVPRALAGKVQPSTLAKLLKLKFPEAYKLCC